MKIKSPATILTMLLLCLALAPAAGAQTAVQSSKGLYQFTLGDSYLKYLDFSAEKADGRTLGQMYFSDEAPIRYEDVDGTGDRNVGTVKGFYIKAELDDLVINKNKAVMSGTIQDSSIFELVGLRVLLTVEDNGEDPKMPDRVTWGVYKFEERAWTPSDAELRDDPGVGLRWYATDSERKEDIGYWCPVKDGPAGASSFALDSYAFADATRASGDIYVSQ